MMFEKQPVCVIDPKHDKSRSFMDPIAVSFMPEPLSMIMAFIFGACIGSFLNVCISRMPQSISIVKPGSRCPDCKTPIRAYDNIPILSFLWLRGKCRGCAKSISVRYPLIEALTGGLAVAVLLKFGLSFDAAVYFIFMCALVVITFIDIDHQIIPDIISLPGIPVGILASILLSSLTFWESIIGAVFGGGILLSIAWGYYLFTGKEGMGGGDIKLLAMIGAFVGWQGVVFTIFLSSVTGTVVGVLLMAFARKDLKFAVPFGPFLSIGAIVYVFFGPAVITWYYYG